MNHDADVRVKMPTKAEIREADLHLAATAETFRILHEKPLKPDPPRAQPK